MMKTSLHRLVHQWHALSYSTFLNPPSGSVVHGFFLTNSEQIVLGNLNTIYFFIELRIDL
jgi:hypothetical protein